jgi:hypothetical protein
MCWSHVPTWSVSGFGGCSSRHTAARPNRQQQTVWWGGWCHHHRATYLHCLPHRKLWTKWIGLLGPILVLMSMPDVALDAGGSHCGQLIVISCAFNPALHDSFDTVMHASASSTQTNSDASYDSVGQGGEESTPGRINTSQGVNNVSPGGLTQGIRALNYTARSNNPSVVSETP